MIRPPEWSVGSGKNFLDIEFMIELRHRHPAQRFIVRKVAQIPELLHREPRWRIFILLACFIFHDHGQDILQNIFLVGLRHLSLQDFI